MTTTIATAILSVGLTLGTVLLVIMALWWRKVVRQVNENKENIESLNYAKNEIFKIMESRRLKLMDVFVTRTDERDKLFDEVYRNIGEHINERNRMIDDVYRMTEEQNNELEKRIIRNHLDKRFEKVYKQLKMKEQI